jgi:hypothetical protein
LLDGFLLFLVSPPSLHFEFSQPLTDDDRIHHKNSLNLYSEQPTIHYRSIMTKTPKRRVSPRSPSKKAEPVKVTRTAKAAKPSAKPTKINSASKKVAKSKRTAQPHSKKNRFSQAVLDANAGKAFVHWEQCFSDLQDFKKVHGHCLVPKRFKENQTLAYWVQRNRR